MIAIAQKPLRSELGDFNSIICTKAIVVGIEDALGEKAAAIALIAAGRKRGKDLVESLGLANAGADFSLEDLKNKMNEAIGKNGTCLCTIDRLAQDGDKYVVDAKETICSAGEAPGSNRNCTFTLGAIQGALESMLNKRLRGNQTASVLRGGQYDTIEYSVLG
jgi:predicted hydrocarbon binding protein